MPDSQTDPTQPIDWRIVISVLVAGAVGGFLAWIYAVTVGQPPQDVSFWLLLAWIALGTGASFIGVYLIASTDTRHLLRCFAFAVICGFSWKAVYESARALVDKHIQQESTRQLKEMTHDAKTATAALEQAPPDKLEGAIQQLADVGAELIRRAQNVKDYKSRKDAEAQSRQIVTALGKASDKAPVAFARAVDQLAATAIASRDTEFAQHALASLTAQGTAEENPDRLVLLAGRLGSLKKTAAIARAWDLALVANQKESQTLLTIGLHTGPEWHGWKTASYDLSRAYNNLACVADIYGQLGDNTSASVLSSWLSSYKQDVAGDEKLRDLFIRGLAMRCRDLAAQADPYASPEEVLTRAIKMVGGDDTPVKPNKDESQDRPTKQKDE